MNNMFTPDFPPSLLNLSMVEDFKGKVLNIFMVILGLLFIVSSLTLTEEPDNTRYGGFIVGLFILYRVYKNLKGDYSNMLERDKNWYKNWYKDFF